jgi:hypothetical protein
LIDAEKLIPKMDIQEVYLRRKTQNADAYTLVFWSSDYREGSFANRSERREGIPVVFLLVNVGELRDRSLLV